jgi:lipopolysaccharide transport system permease protein
MNDTPSRVTKIIRPPAFSLHALAVGLRELASHGDLLYTLSLHRIRVRYKQSMLGWAWAIVQPFALMLIYTIIFSLFTRIETNSPVPYAVFVYTALLPWTFFANAVSNSATSLVNHSQLITKVYFPREILPITYVIAAVFDLAAATAVLAGMMFYFQVPVHATILYAVPAIAVAAAFATALSLLLAAVQVKFRDIGLAMPLILQIWMFATPVVYPLHTVPARFRPFYDLNPMAGVIEAFRRAVLEGREPDWIPLCTALLVTTALLTASYLYFKHREATMADVT